MGKIAYLFSGQGSQYPGMGKELYDNFKIVRDTLKSVNEILNTDLLDIIFNGPEDKLKLTENTQPAILAVSIAFMKLMEEYGIKCDGAAGLSLGEYSALVASGALRFEDGLPLVKKRGRFMQEAVPEGLGTMAAIVGLERQEVLQIIKDASRYGIVEGANFNCPGQIVVAGEVYAVQKAVEIAKDRGASRSLILPVSAPFHSSMLKGAGSRLNQELLKIDFFKGNTPVIANVDSQYYGFDREEIIDKLTRQVYNPVMFEDSILKLIDDGFDTFIELGPGRALSGFVKRISKGSCIFSVEDMKSSKKTLQGLGVSV